MHRLQNVIDNLVSQDQVGYIKGRHLGENCRKIIDIFEYTENIKDPGFILFLDFEKAFDFHIKRIPIPNIKEIQFWV